MIRGGKVEVVSLQNAKSREYARLIYDPVLLDITRETLVPETMSEDAVLYLSQRYFDLIKPKNIGSDLTAAFARWEDMPDIHMLLRGGAKQESFLVLTEGEDGCGLPVGGGFSGGRSLGTA